MEQRDAAMVDKDALVSIMNMVVRRISFMKQHELDEEITQKGKIEFINFWSNAGIKITIDFKDMSNGKESECVNQGSQCSKESGACENPAEH
jgi:hypothetical protein